MLDKLKQIQELRSRASELKAALADEYVDGSGNGGKVIVRINGNQEVQTVTIDHETTNDLAQLQNGIKEAINDGIKKSQQLMARKMSDMGGLNFPGI